jgi:hypothetical protein
MHDHCQVGRTLDRGDAKLARDFRQTRQRLGHAVLYLLLREVGISTDFKGQRESHKAIGVGLRKHIQQVFDTADLFFKRGRNCFGDYRRVCARKLRVDHDGRWHDLGVFRDRQLEHRDKARQHDQKREHTGENGTIDKKAGNVHGNSLYPMSSSC